MGSQTYFYKDQGGLESAKNLPYRFTFKTPANSCQTVRYGTNFALPLKSEGARPTIDSATEASEQPPSLKIAQAATLSERLMSGTKGTRPSQSKCRFHLRNGCQITSRAVFNNVLALNRATFFQLLHDSLHETDAEHGRKKFRWLPKI